jgi:AcrR family transcriptional regulator
MARAQGRSRRTQQERRETTTTGLLEAARELFAHQGYGATSLDQIAAAAGVTKGALYHHFAGKREVFRAVCEREQARLTRLQTEAFRAQDDPWDGFKAGCQAYLEAAIDPGVQRIMLLDAPGVFGWEGMREIEGEAYAMTIAGVRRAMAAGRLPRRDPEPLVELLFGALGGAATAIARDEDQRAALRASVRELRRLLDGLAVG